MNLSIQRTRPFLSAVVAVGLMGACGDDTAATPTEENHDECPAGMICIAEDGARNFSFELAAGHVHIWREVALAFTVRDLDDCTDPEDNTTCAGVAGLSVVGMRRAEGGSSTRTQDLEAGKLTDDGDGVYTWIRSFNDLGTNLVGLKFELDGRTYFDNFAIETSRAGGERYFGDADSDGTEDTAYQIRWNANKGHIHLADNTEVIFTFELMRSTDAQADLNIEKPYRNTFDHLCDTDFNITPTFQLMADEGNNAVTLGAPDAATYKGKGIFEVAHTFMAADLAGLSARTFWYHVEFTDDAGVVVDGEQQQTYDSTSGALNAPSSAEEEFHFSAVAGH